MNFTRLLFNMLQHSLLNKHIFIYRSNDMFSSLGAKKNDFKLGSMKFRVEMYDS